MNIFVRASAKFLCVLLMTGCRTSTAASYEELQRAPQTDFSKCPMKPIEGAVILDMRSSGTIPYFTPKFAQQFLEVYGIKALLTKAGGRTIVGTFKLSGYEDTCGKIVSSDDRMNRWMCNLSAAARLINLAQITIYRYKTDVQVYKCAQKEIFFDETLPEHLDEIKSEFFSTK